jgi:hypothetical protein
LPSKEGRNMASNRPVFMGGVGRDQTRESEAKDAAGMQDKGFSSSVLEGLVIRQKG